MSEGSKQKDDFTAVELAEIINGFRKEREELSDEAIISRLEDFVAIALEEQQKSPFDRSEYYMPHIHRKTLLIAANRLRELTEK